MPFDMVKVRQLGAQLRLVATKFESQRAIT